MRPCSPVECRTPADARPRVKGGLAVGAALESAHLSGLMRRFEMSLDGAMGDRVMRRPSRCE